MTDQLSTVQAVPPTNYVLIRLRHFTPRSHLTARRLWCTQTTYTVRLLLCTTHHHHGTAGLSLLWPQTELNTRSLRNDKLSSPSKYWRQGRKLLFFKIKYSDTENGVTRVNNWLWFWISETQHNTITISIYLIQPSVWCLASRVISGLSKRENNLWNICVLLIMIGLMALAEKTFLLN